MLARTSNGHASQEGGGTEAERVMPRRGWIFGPSSALATSLHATESREGMEDRVEGGGDSLVSGGKWGAACAAAAEAQVGLVAPLDAGVCCVEDEGVEVVTTDTEPSTPPIAAVTERGAEEQGVGMREDASPELWPSTFAEAGSVISCACSCCCCGCWGCRCAFTAAGRPRVRVLCAYGWLPVEQGSCKAPG